MKRFVLKRSEDISGSSGVGKVVEGVQFSDGKCAITWLSYLKSYAVYDSIHVLLSIHDHEGRITVERIDK